MIFASLEWGVWGGDQLQSHAVILRVDAATWRTGPHDMLPNVLDGLTRVQDLRTYLIAKLYARETLLPIKLVYRWGKCPSTLVADIKRLHAGPASLHCRWTKYLRASLLSLRYNLRASL